MLVPAAMHSSQPRSWQSGSRQLLPQRPQNHRIRALLEQTRSFDTQPGRAPLPAALPTHVPQQHSRARCGHQYRHPICASWSSSAAGHATCAEVGLPQVRAAQLPHPSCGPLSRRSGGERQRQVSASTPHLWRPWSELPPTRPQRGEIPSCLYLEGAQAVTAPVDCQSVGAASVLRQNLRSATH